MFDPKELAHCGIQHTPAATGVAGGVGPGDAAVYEVGRGSRDRPTTSVTRDIESGDPPYRTGHRLELTRVVPDANSIT
jgi:hypothetical protein